MATLGRWSAREHAYMERALALGRAAAGRTRPNPSVGAVLVRDGRVVGEGATEPAGGRHAERVALAQAGHAARGATLYVTLEPCSHTGRTPPCTEAVIAAGVARVVAAVGDPSPRVDGRGFARLEDAGLRVDVGLKARAAAAAHAPFASWCLRQRPYVVAKWAMTADGRIASRTGDARWVSGNRSREHVHALRNHHDAIMVGVGTVLQDNPRLTCRRPAGRDPVRVICDSLARTPPGARCITTGSGPTLVAVTPAAPAPRMEALKAVGAELLVVESEGVGGRVALAPLLYVLAQRELTSLLVEGGGRLLASLAAAALIDRYEIFLAPKWIGGASAPGPLGGAGRERMAEAERLVWRRAERSGGDLWLSAYPEGGEPLDVFWHRG